MSPDRFIRPTPQEIALGVSGRVPPAPASPPGPGLTARRALEEVVDGYLGDRPVFVGFSGGRDSSAVLAVAAACARRRGLPEPVPVIRRYPGDPDSDETQWQELVLRHLGIADPVVVEVVERATYLDDVARANLRRRGLLWPASLQLGDPTLPIVAGGVFLTGEGGDEVLGTRRITPLTLLLRLHRHPSRALLRWALMSALPPALLHGGAGIDDQLPWLTDAARRRLAAMTRHGDRRPLHWGRETLQLLEQRVPAVLDHNYQVIADDFDVRLGHPLLAPRFLQALAVEGGRWGFAGRTALMRHLFSDLLPDELLARSSKAHFGAVRWGEPERDFARRWNGSGLPELIDPEALRAEWLSERPSGASALALHAAWMHSEGLPFAGASLESDAMPGADAMLGAGTGATPELGKS